MHGSVMRAVLVEDQPGQRHAGLDALDDDDGNGVVRVVQHAMNHGDSGGQWVAAGYSGSGGSEAMVALRRTAGQLDHLDHLHKIEAAR